MTCGVVVAVPPDGAMFSQFPSELTLAENGTVPLDDETKTGTVEIVWPGSAQKTRGEGVMVSVLSCAMAELAAPMTIRATAIRRGTVLAGLFKAFFQSRPFRPR